MIFSSISRKDKQGAKIPHQKWLVTTCLLINDAGTNGRPLAYRRAHDHRRRAAAHGWVGIRACWGGSALCDSRLRFPRNLRGTRPRICWSLGHIYATFARRNLIDIGLRHHGIFRVCGEQKYRRRYVQDGLGSHAGFSLSKTQFRSQLKTEEAI